MDISGNISSKTAKIISNICYWIGNLFMTLLGLKLIISLCSDNAESIFIGMPNKGYAIMGLVAGLLLTCALYTTMYLLTPPFKYLWVRIIRSKK